MREIRQSGSEGGGNEQTVSPYPYLPAPLLLVFLDSPLSQRMTEEEARPMSLKYTPKAFNACLNDA